jgi:hypothetical protein
MILESDKSRNTVAVPEGAAGWKQWNQLNSDAVCIKYV